MDANYGTDSAKVAYQVRMDLFQNPNVSMEELNSYNSDGRHVVFLFLPLTPDHDHLNTLKRWKECEDLRDPMFDRKDDIVECIEKALYEFLGDVGGTQVIFNLLKYDEEKSVCILRVNKQSAADFLATLSLVRAYKARKIAIVSKKYGPYLQSVF